MSENDALDGFRFIKSMQMLSIQEIGQFIKEEMYKEKPSQWKIERAMQVAKWKWDKGER